MKKIKLIIFAVIAVFLISAPSVQAITPNQEAFANRIAKDFFPQSLCVRDGITLVHETNMAQYTRIDDSIGLYTPAAVYLSGCTIVIDARYDVYPVQWCKFYVHEFGHSALTETNADHDNLIGGGIMTRDGVWGNNWHACDDILKVPDIFQIGTRKKIGRSKSKLPKAFKKLKNTSHGKYAIN